MHRGQRYKRLVPPQQSLLLLVPVDPTILCLLQLEDLRTTTNYFPFPTILKMMTSKEVKC